MTKATVTKVYVLFSIVLLAAALFGSTLVNSSQNAIATVMWNGCGKCSDNVSGDVNWSSDVSWSS